MAIEDHFGLPDVHDSFKHLSSFLPKYTEANSTQEQVALVDLINVTDFIDLSRILKFFNRDRVEQCLDLLRKDKSVV